MTVNKYGGITASVGIQIIKIMDTRLHGYDNALDWCHSCESGNPEKQSEVE